MTTIADEDLHVRIHAEYREMPGLKLTLAQASRLFNLEPVLSEAEQSAKVSRDVWHQGLADEVVLKRLIENHARYTGSTRAHEILEQWNTYRLRFVKVFPKEYQRALAELAAAGRKAAA